MADIERFLMIPADRYQHMLTQLNQLKKQIADQHQSPSNLHQSSSDRSEPDTHTPMEVDHDPIPQPNDHVPQSTQSNHTFQSDQGGSQHAGLTTEDRNSHTSDETVSTDHTASEDKTTKRMAKTRILTAIPRQYRSRASRLLDLLGTKLDWDDKGQLVKHNGDVVKGSHISDLLRDTQVPYKSIVVEGRDYFHKIMDEVHVPNCLRNISTRKDVRQGGSSKTYEHQSKTSRQTPTISKDKKTSKTRKTSTNMYGTPIPGWIPFSK